MMNLQILIYSVGFISLTGLMYGWFLSVDSLVAMAVFLPAGVWAYSLRREWQLGYGLGFVFVTFLAAVGMWRGMPVWLGLTAVIAAILFWDLTNLQSRANFAADDEGREVFVRRHLFRLFLWLMAAVGLGAFALLGKMRFSFNQALGLLALIIIGLGFMVYWLRTRGQSS